MINIYPPNWVNETDAVRRINGEEVSCGELHGCVFLSLGDFVVSGTRSDLHKVQEVINEALLASQ